MCRRGERLRGAGGELLQLRPVAKPPRLPGAARCDADAHASVARILTAESPLPFVARGFEHPAVALVERAAEARDQFPVRCATLQEMVGLQVVLHAA